MAIPGMSWPMAGFPVIAGIFTSASSPCFRVGDAEDTGGGAQTIDEGTGLGEFHLAGGNGAIGGVHPGGADLGGEVGTGGEGGKIIIGLQGVAQVQTGRGNKGDATLIHRNKG